MIKKIVIDNWRKTSIPIFGGFWSMGYCKSSSNCIVWSDIPSDSDKIVTSRGISNHFKG